MLSEVICSRMAFILILNKSLQAGKWQKCLIAKQSQFGQRSPYLDTVDVNRFGQQTEVCFSILVHL